MPCQRNGERNWDPHENGGAAAGELLATTGTAAFVLAQGGDLL